MLFVRLIDYPSVIQVFFSRKVSSVSYRAHQPIGRLSLRSCYGVCTPRLLGYLESVLGSKLLVFLTSCYHPDSVAHWASSAS